MSIGFHDEPTLRALSPRGVAEWLRMHGFKDQGSYGEYGMIFARDVEGVTCELVLPTTPQTRDFGRRMEEFAARSFSGRGSAPRAGQ